MQGKLIYDFINSSLNKLFQRFNITINLLKEDSEEWHTNLNYQKGIELFSNLRGVNHAVERGVKLINNYSKIIT